MPETARLVTPRGENFWCQIIVSNIKKLENI
jgi:hypothetical protein